MNYQFTGFDRKDLNRLATKQSSAIDQKAMNQRFEQVLQQVHQKANLVARRHFILLKHLQRDLIVDQQVWVMMRRCLYRLDHQTSLFKLKVATTLQKEKFTKVVTSAGPIGLSSQSLKHHQIVKYFVVASCLVEACYQQEATKLLRDDSIFRDSAAFTA